MLRPSWLSIAEVTFAVRPSGRCARGQCLVYLRRLVCTARWRPNRHVALPEGTRRSCRCALRKGHASSSSCGGRGIPASDCGGDQTHDTQQGRGEPGAHIHPQLRGRGHHTACRSPESCTQNAGIQQGRSYQGLRRPSTPWEGAIDRKGWQGAAMQERRLLPAMGRVVGLKDPIVGGRVGKRR